MASSMYDVRCAKENKFWHPIRHLIQFNRKYGHPPFLTRHCERGTSAAISSLVNENQLIRNQVFNKWHPNRNQM